jgi:hypothetical protein
MTSALLMGTPSLFDLDPPDEGGTLDELVADLWQGLRSDRPVACPVCGAEMRPDYGVHARAVGGSCAHCGASLR